MPEQDRDPQARRGERDDHERRQARGRCAACAAGRAARRPRRRRRSRASAPPGRGSGSSRRQSPTAARTRRRRAPRRRRARRLAMTYSSQPSPSCSATSGTIMSAKASRPPSFSSGRKIAKNSSVRCSLWGSSSDGAPGPRRCGDDRPLVEVERQPARHVEHEKRRAGEQDDERGRATGGRSRGSMSPGLAGATSDAACVVALMVGGHRSAGPRPDPSPSCVRWRCRSSPNAWRMRPYEAGDLQRCTPSSTATSRRWRCSAGRATSPARASRWSAR